MLWQPMHSATPPEWKAWEMPRDPSARIAPIQTIVILAGIIPSLPVGFGTPDDRVARSLFQAKN